MTGYTVPILLTVGPTVELICGPYWGHDWPGSSWGPYR